MRVVTRLPLLIGLLLLASVAADAASTPDATRKLDAIVAAAARKGQFTGSVLIARSGRVLLRKAYGYADVDRRVPNRPDTQFRISSLTSTFTLVGVLQLVDRGLLARDASICTYVKPCPAAWKSISTELLLNGRSGLPLLPVRTGPPRSVAAWIEWLAARPLRFQPGHGRDRGDARFLVAAYLLEGASRQPWLRYLERHIFRPLGMRATGLDRADAARRAKPYVRTKQRTFSPPLTFPALSTPDVVYGLMSTVDDMFRFDTALRTGRLVSLDTLGPEWSRHVELGHGRHGTADGWYTAYTYRGEDAITILAFSNLGGIFLGDLEARLFLAALGWPPRRVALDESTLARYPGVYSRWDSYYKRRSTLTVAEASDGLLRVRWDRFPPRLHGLRIRPHEALIAPFSSTGFFELRGLRGSRTEAGTTFTFDGDSGPAEAVVIENKADRAPVRYRRG